MNKVTELLTRRFKKSETQSKMAGLAQASAEGKLSGFSGIFAVSELNPSQKKKIEDILNEYATGEQNVVEDLQSLSSLTAEVHAINNQSIMLHGERIKKAQNILKSYNDGAFSAWLIATYGNRQTPYNLLQYYEFYHSVPSYLRPMIETMPRQAVYTLASREGPIDDKQRIVESYVGQTKSELIALIREQFPLDSGDRRRQNIGDNATRLLKQLCSLVANQKAVISQEQRQEMNALWNTFQQSLERCPKN